MQEAEEDFKYVIVKNLTEIRENISLVEQEEDAIENEP